MKSAWKLLVVIALLEELLPVHIRVLKWLLGPSFVTVILKDLTALVWFSSSVAVMLNVVVVSADTAGAVPVIAPVAVARDKPVGKVPVVTAYSMVSVPSVAVTTGT